MLQQLNDNQFRTLSEITRDVGQVLLASTVVPYLTGLDKIGLFAVASGAGGSLAFWMLSVRLSGRIKNG